MYSASSKQSPRARTHRRYKEAKNISFRERYLFRGQAAQQGFPLFSFRVVGKIYLVHFHKTTIKNYLVIQYKLFLNIYCKHIKLLSFYKKESYNVTIIPSWDSADDVQPINVDVILYTVHWLADNIYVYFCVQLYTVNIFLKICF